MQSLTTQSSDHEPEMAPLNVQQILLCRFYLALAHTNSLTELSQAHTGV